MVKHIAKRGQHLGKWVLCAAEYQCRNGGEHASDELIQATKAWLNNSGEVRRLSEITLEDYHKFVAANSDPITWIEANSKREKATLTDGAIRKEASKFELKANVSCAQCGINFHLRPSKVKNNKSGLFFCQKDHRDAYIKTSGKSGKVVKCSYCGEKVQRKESKLGSKTGLHYCSKEHLAKHRQKLADIQNPGRRTKASGKCSRCQKFRQQSKLYDGLCNNCKNREESVATWLSGDLSVTYTGLTKEPRAFIKEYLIEIRGDKCEICSFAGQNADGASIIQMDHIDGNYLNNDIKNLMLLCPNHHTMTTTFGSRNTKNIGRRRMAKILSLEKEHSIDLTSQ